MNLYIFCQKLLVHTARTLKINRLMYRFSKSKKISFDTSMITEARDYLENHSTNPKTSCVCINNIEPLVDIHIIIPAYNVEKYIEECMDSITLNPTKKYTYLVTVINDGSTDKTTEILKKYKNLPNVEIITQKNKGFSGARNTGLSHIKGKYILFVDSDDFIDWRGVEKMMDTAIKTGADIIRGSHTTITDDGSHPRLTKTVPGKIAINDLGGQPWAKLFRSELFRNVCFPEFYWYEDSIFAQIVYPQISFAYGVSENTYYYRNRISGITNQGIKKKKSIDSYWITERLFEERRNYGLKITDQYYEYILRMLKLTFSRIRLQPDKVKKYVFILFCNFIDKNFVEFSATSKEGKEIERIIKTRDFGKCISYSKWM